MHNLHSLANQVLDRCGSTNDIAKALAENHFPHGTWVSTRIQTAGKGRLGRTWESIEGNLFLSIVVRIENKALWSWVPLTTAVGVTRWLRSKFPGLNFQVKWPNDLWLAGMKLGGILCEGAGTHSQAFIVVGMGLNCLHSPENLDQGTTDLTTALGRGPIIADEIRRPILEAILHEIDGLICQGPFQVKQAYDLWAAIPTGTEIEWGNPLQCGRIEGLGHSGELLVKCETSTQRSLFAEDVKIRRKKGSPERS